ncbi:MAG: hypothetical protein ACTSUE_08125 [Promethearchaeota archaeon]
MGNIKTNFDNSFSGYHNQFNIIDFIHSNENIVYINRQNKSVNGKLFLDGNYYFFKILPSDVAKNELIGYNSIKELYPVSKFHGCYNFGHLKFLFYEFELTIHNNKGLLIDSVFNQNFDALHHFRDLLYYYKESFRNTKHSTNIYPTRRFFKERLDRISKIIDSNTLRKYLDCNYNINGVLFKIRPIEMINETIQYFLEDNQEICFMSQGDPLLINIGNKPIMFDYEVAGINPIIGEMAIFFWGCLIAEFYFYPKYHPEAYFMHDAILGKLKEYRPRFEMDVNENQELITVDIDFKPSTISIKLISIFYSELIENFGLVHEFQKKFKYFLLMRILGTLDTSLFSKSDFLLSLVLLLILTQEDEVQWFNE